MKLGWAGRAVITVLASLLSGPLRMSRLVTPEVAAVFDCVTNRGER